MRGYSDFRAPMDLCISLVRVCGHSQIRVSALIHGQVPLYCHNEKPVAQGTVDRSRELEGLSSAHTYFHKGDSSLTRPSAVECARVCRSALKTRIPVDAQGPAGESVYPPALNSHTRPSRGPPTGNANLQGI